MSSAVPPVIIGYDAVSPLGIDLQDQWKQALAGRSGIGRLDRFEFSQDFPVHIAGQLADIDHLPYPFLKPREQARWPSPIFKYALLTVQRALTKSGLEITPRLAPRVAVTFSSAVGGMDTVLAADRRLAANGKLPAPCVNPNSCINMVGGKVSMLTGATGPISATITACATGLTSLLTGAMLLETGRADVAICGAVDCALVAPIVAGFATMNGAYVPKSTGPGNAPLKWPAPETASRPFSKHRRGFVISEGAGCMLLATRKFAQTHGFDANIELAGWSMTSDAYHFVAPNLPTVKRCITESIYDAGLDAGDIEVINAHAASTRVGDQVEYDALREVFGNRLPVITANKSLIGHAMGAASAIETIFTIMGLETQMVPPTINYHPDPDLVLDDLPTQAMAREHSVALKNAFGFGGCNACAVFRRTA